MSVTIEHRPATDAPRFRLRVNPGWIGAAILLLIALPCLVTLPWSIGRYDQQNLGEGQADPRRPPSLHQPFEPLGSDALGRSLLWRCALGGVISLGIGAAAASISVVIGVLWGATAAMAGGRTDAVLMRIVDVLYGLPYILLVVLLNLALSPALERAARQLLPTDTASAVADVVTLLIAIGSVSWLTMARVIRGQVLSLRSRPFIEAARASGLGRRRILFSHLLPNLVGPIVVYTTLTVPTAILQESFLSFLGIGVQPPLPSWGNLAADGVAELPALLLDFAGSGPGPWWLIFWPCALLGLTLLSLNLVGDALRDRLDPATRRRA
ncbi:MAG: ABC transporter permease [Phycisphaeraceae bacterium]|nr:ABC transporter permease [Phycisphaeraceae bacterium]